MDNIDEATNIYNAVDVSFIDAFAEEYNQTVDNTGDILQSDTIYEKKDSVWVKASSIAHSVTFDLATSSTKLENQTASYQKDEQIVPPMVEDLIKVVLEDGTIKYYQFKGWYLDASYLYEAQEEDFIMADRNRTFYAKYLDITSTVTITSSYHEDIVLTSYIGDSISTYYDLYDLVAVDGKMYRFEGYLYNGEECDSILEKEVTLTAIWNEVEFYVIYDEAQKLLSTTEDNSFLSDTSYVPMNITIQNASSTIYYRYPGDVLTPKYILNTFSSLFVYNEDTNHLELEIFRTLPQDEYVSTSIDEELGTMGYIPNQVVEAIGLSKQKLIDFEVNAWVDENGLYYSWYDILVKTNRDVVFQGIYASTPQSSLNFEIADTAKITGFHFGTSVKLLITPRYVYANGQAVLVTVIGSNAFFGAEEKGSLFNKKIEYYHNLETVVLHEGLVEIEANAFKNSNMLKAVYLPSTLTNVATDAFYMDVVSKAETNQGYAKNVKFHMFPNSTLNVGDWLAYKWNLTKHNYNSNNVPNSIVEETKSIVESVYTILSI